MATLDATHDQVCSICRTERATAHWHLELFVCHNCATTKLPQLIADACPGRHANTLQYDLLKIEAAFWRGIAYRVLTMR